MNLHGILKKGQGRRLFAVSAVAALGLAIGAAPSMATVGDMHSVTFCHRNSDTKDPYVVGITTDSAAIIGPTGHSGHTGPVFDLTGGKTQPAWGDIIPAFDYVDSNGDPQHYGGLNVDTATGLDFLANGCKLPEGPHLSTLTLVKEVVNTGGGKATAIDWTLTAAGTSSFEGTTPVSSDVVVPGDYKLSETAHSDAQNSAYKASAWDCGNMYGSIAVTESTVTVGENMNVTCTITNTFVVPLVVDKEVTPAASATQGTCDAAGKVTLVTKTGYSWSGNTGTADVPTYTATAATGYVLTRSGVFTFNGLSRLPSDSAECVVAPAPVVAGVVENAPVVAGVVKNAPVVAGVVKNAPAVKSLAFTGAETVPLGLSGLLALVLGAVLTVASRQRPKQARE